MMKNKKGIAPIIIIIGLLAVAVAIGWISLGSITGTGEYIERPIFKYVKCEAISGLIYSEVLNIPSYSWLNKPSTGSYYNIKLKVEDTPTLGFPYIIYSVCNSQVNSQANCRIYNAQAVIPDVAGTPTFLIFGSSSNAVNVGNLFDINNIRINEFVYINYKRYFLFNSYDITGLSVQIGFVPYGLREYDVLSGSSNPINPNNCDISVYNSKNDYIKSEDLSKISAVSPKTNQNVFQPEEIRWYVSGYVTSASPSFKLIYNGQEAWCRSTGTTGEIYKINQIVLGSGTYKIASPDYSDFLGSVTCCPKSTQGNSVCQDDFIWKSIVNSECGAFKSCGSPDWVPYSATSLIKYSCVNGKCENQIQNVECSSNYACVNSNQVCDLNIHKCVEANVNLKGQKITPSPDNKADCETAGGTWKTQKTQTSSFWNFLGIGKPEIITTEYCDMGTPWYMWILYIFLGLLALFVIIRFVLPYLLPFIKRIIP